MATVEDPLPSPRAPYADDSYVDDADVEETADESQAPASNGSAFKKRRRFVKRMKPFSESTPNTPRAGGNGSPTGRRFPGMPRRSTMPDPDERGAVSEGEGRARHARRPMARRGHSLAGDAEDVETPGSHRRGHFRGMSMFSSRGGVSDGDTGTTLRRPRLGTERHSTFGGQKWKQVKSTLGLLRSKKIERIDYLKSTELMGELRAGAPAVIMFASMIQRDEHGNKKIPVLLEQVRLTVADSEIKGTSGRHGLFTIHLEYGSGTNQMVWDVKRSLGSIIRMHLKYKSSVAHIVKRGVHTRKKQPKFPYMAFPYLRDVKRFNPNDLEEETNPTETPVETPAPETSQLPQLPEDEVAEATAGEMTAAEGTATDAEERPRIHRRKGSRMNILSPRRKGSTMLDDALAPGVQTEEQKRQYALQLQRQAVERYFHEMVRWLMFRPDSNRLCRFLELSALGVRLASEGGSHGKEGFMQLRPANELVNQARKVLRKDRKWFLVRQSYIVCVDSPESIDISDVYLFDPKFELITKKKKKPGKEGKGKSKKNKPSATAEADEDDDDDDLAVNTVPKHHHKLTIVNSERKVDLYAMQHDLPQFEDSVKKMLECSTWCQSDIRFDSFAPVRQNVFAQWLVDGRDYMWNVSRAISMAKDVIYIHDWWLTPELYMRRPPCISQRWRLDRLLQQKASEGVKIFVIVYRNVEAAVPIDSEYTKKSLLNLHPNIFVQRSPNQYKKNQYFFAHHEKVLIVDHYIAFCGGIDLCFGRWDTPQHPLSDDKPTGFEPTEFQDVPRDSEHVQMFPGKDYSNPRVQDFFRMDQPYEEMYDRSKTPRMPWHDISMQVVGQPARDLTRHFIQRWNYLRRTRRVTRPLPFLLPPPDFRDQDLVDLGLDGTCEVQILRSATTWSLGTSHTECSIQNAYVQMIEKSDHFVYIENQFFISSSEALGTLFVNKIGDALVERIKRAHENDEDWKAIILIPLMPGFQNTVAETEGTSVRLIMQCQFRSISRGESSIFGRLRAADIDPEDYIQFFSLRQWGKIGPNQDHATEQLYIHAKTIIVDDRIALIGSANINERSMLGSRDSEIAAIVRDRDMIWSKMGGEDYQVSRFAHTLRMRLMREHLGLPVDDILEEERMANMDEEFESDMDRMYGSDSEGSSNSGRASSAYLAPGGSHRPTVSRGHSVNHDVDLQLDAAARRASSSSSRSTDSSNGPQSSVEALPDPVQQRDVAGYGADHWKDAQKKGLDQGRDTVLVNGREILTRDILSEGRGTIENPTAVGHSVKPYPVRMESSESGPSNFALPPLDRRGTEQLGLPRANQLPDLPQVDDSDIGGPSMSQDETRDSASPLSHPLASEIRQAAIDKDCMVDPLDEHFYENIWVRVAENNTRLFRQVFHCMPDNEVYDWPQYMEFMDHQTRLKRSQEGPQEHNEKAEQTDNSHHTEKEASKSESTAGGAGISAPGPVPAVQAIKKKFAKEPSLNNPGATAKAMNTDLENETPAKRHARQNSRLDVERAAAAARALHSPAASPGLVAPTNSPFGRTSAPADPEKAAAANRDANGTSDAHMHVPGSSTTEKGDRHATFDTPELNSSSEKPPASSGSGNASTTQTVGGSVKRRKRAGTKSSRHRPQVEAVLTREQMDGLCGLIQGSLVVFPYHWLEGAEERGDWLTLVDQAAPLQIYD